MLLRLIKSTKGIDINLEKLPLNDSPTYKLLRAGKTIGVFQLESEGMRELMKKMHPESFKDLIALLALYRPGPLGGGQVDAFIKRKEGKEANRLSSPFTEIYTGRNLWDYPLSRAGYAE